MTHLREQYFAVEVPEVISNPHFYRVNSRSIMLKWDDVKRPLNPFDVVEVDIYEGNLDEYKWPIIVCTSKDITRWQASELVENRWCEEEKGEEAMIFIGYENSKEVWSYDPLDALRSLLTSRGLDLNKQYLILKK